jgi:elongation factor Tu
MSNPHIEATITVLRTEEGGRKNPVYQGYRPQFNWQNSDWDAKYDMGVEVGVEVAKPGGTFACEITLSTGAQEEILPKMETGMEFELREGARVIARGTITKIIK